MGDRKPKKTSSGNADAHKAKQVKNQADRPPTAPVEVKKKDKKK